MSASPLRVREYGTVGPPVVVLHGGPGAPGSMAPVARTLSDQFHVLEPLQRRSGPGRLTVARHIADLHEVVSRLEGSRPALLGHSWGAMLALAYAAAHPDCAQALVLIGSGTFDLAARDRMRAIREERMDDEMRRRLENLPRDISDADERLQKMDELLAPVYSYDPLPSEPNEEACDARGHEETWEDMIRLQEAGLYPGSFAAIKVPVLMLHGAFDPHPGGLILASLEPYLPQIEYREWDRCGHSPWLEKAVRDEFFRVTREWLSRRFAGDLGDVRG